jgi:hypothetical protein
VESLDLAIGLRPIAADALAADPELSGRLGEQDRLGIRLGVVGQPPLDPHAVLGEEGGRLDQEAGRGRGRLVGEELAEGDRERSSTAEWMSS